MPRSPRRPNGRCRGSQRLTNSGNIRAGIVATLFGVGTERANSDENDVITDVIRDSSGQTIGRAGDRLVEREIEVRPTISVRPGARIRVLISRDLLLDPA